MHLDMFNFPKILGYPLQFLRSDVEIEVGDFDLMFSFLLCICFRNFLCFELEGLNNNSVDWFFGHNKIFIVFADVFIHSFFIFEFQ